MTETRIFYFLGHLPAQMNHGLFLYKTLPGECLVTTEEAANYCQKHRLNYQMLDTYSHRTPRFSFSHIPNTLRYLNAQKGTVFFFDTFTGLSDLSGSLKTIMLFHGNSIKMRWFRPWRVACLKKFDWMLGLGPYWHHALIRRGIPPKKILPVGSTRADELLQNPEDPGKKAQILAAFKEKKPIITYMPTWYGTTSVSNLGFNLIKSFPAKYHLVIRLHPETPEKIAVRYETLCENRSNVLYAPEGRFPDLDLTALLQGSDGFIVDMSSILLDAILIDKPVLFALDGSFIRRSYTAMKYLPIWDFYRASQKITPKTAANLSRLLDAAFQRKVPEKTRLQIRQKFFYHLDGKAIPALAEFLAI